MTKSTWTHERSYRSLSIASLVHRSRLRAILRTLRQLYVADAGTLADFGCSNGYILRLLRDRMFQEQEWTFYGYDHSEQQLALARNGPNDRLEFGYIDLNSLATAFNQAFDIVTCFETLEHTGNLRNAFTNLYRACAPGGHVVISIPNETGAPGLLKYVGRKLIRRNPYGTFFDGQSQSQYVWRLLTGTSIDGFRSPDATGWGPHLGFDWRVFDEFLSTAFIQTGKCRIVSLNSVFLGFGRIYVIQKLI